MNPDAEARRGGALSGLRRVRVGTRNPPKIDAVRRAVGAYASGIVVEGSAVASGVAEQPVGLAEIARGARNRARAAFRSGACDLAVGLEDGLAVLPGLESEGALNLGCAVVWDGRRESLGLSSGFAYPPGCVEPALARRAPIGDVFDAFWRERHPDDVEPPGPSALSVGNVGRLSDGALTRSEYARHAVLCALIRFVQPDLYPPAGREGDA